MIRDWCPNLVNYLDKAIQTEPDANSSIITFEIILLYCTYVQCIRIRVIYWTFSKPLCMDGETLSLVITLLLFLNWILR